jgi:hypothetical protein
MTYNNKPPPPHLTKGTVINTGQSNMLWVACLPTGESLGRGGKDLSMGEAIGASENNDLKVA